MPSTAHHTALYKTFKTFKIFKVLDFVQKNCISLKIYFVCFPILQTIFLFLLE